MNRQVKVLVIGFGNPARADDMLGPALAEIVESKGIAGVSVEVNYQLTIEDSAQVAENDIVIFADACVDCAEPFSFEPIGARSYPDSFSSHNVDPEAILYLAETLFGARTKGYVLAIRGYEFDRLGSPLSDRARANLQKAVDFLVELLSSKNFDKIEIVACS